MIDLQAISFRPLLLLAGILTLVACTDQAGGPGQFSVRVDHFPFERPAPRAQCDAGSRPESAPQGQITLAQGASGDSPPG